MSWFSLWIFLWEDVIEATGTSTDSTLTTDFAWLHDEALKYVEFQLELSSSPVDPPSPTKYCVLFKYAGGLLRAACTVPERRRFYDEVREYMKGCEVEQTYVRAGEIPSLHGFWENRISTSSTVRLPSRFLCLLAPFSLRFVAFWC